jgi:hypothetical protein
MIVITIFLSLFLLIYVGADFSNSRIENRSNNEFVENLWWEKSFILVCPLH